MALEKTVDGQFRLLRNGEPFEVRGVGYVIDDGTDADALALLAASGGNAIRTWGVDQLEIDADGKNLLDLAHEHGIAVTLGFWVKHARHGFDYDDVESVNRQRELLREAVLTYRDHPALLMWGLGNEMEKDFTPGASEETDPRVWKELNHLAGIINELDPNHPVMTVVDGTPASKIDSIRKLYPRLDILGINSYAGATSAGERALQAGWDGPYMLTEFGVTGTWEVQLTTWGAPIEPDPSTKAAESYTAYTVDRDRNPLRNLGSYVFLWGSKQEATFSWFGMLLPSGEKLARVDAMAYAWTGDWPTNRVPKLESMTSPVAFKEAVAGTTTYAKVDCSDREGDALRYSWEVRAESSDRRVGGDAEAAPPSFPDAISKGQGTDRIEFKVPDTPGGYRLFVTAYDGKGGAAVHNLPFYVP
ncbi:MAG: glycoside hydrolase family 2 TIM barrel-domain containing protein [Pseudomonadota bacterium]